jgi:hypothetical protein
LTAPAPSEHHVTIPMHAALRVGTLSAIVTAVAEAQGMDRGELLKRLFGS